ncbi:MAG: hypothetical protein JSV51_01740 [Candidatus Bathyarchaeota archaeon]|nr:MAG: hypothetical protein JSV51_01740 [Candidatus Bathyarchaeota archaeon]
MVSEEKTKGTEKLKKLAELKASLEIKIAEADTNLDNLKTLLEFVNETLLEKGFKRAELIKPKPVKAAELPSAREQETVIPLKSVTGDLLANLHVTQDSMQLIIAKDKIFNVNTPPFQQFLIERVLNKMLEKDNQAASRGEISNDKIFSYKLVQDGDKIQSIMIRNLTTNRSRELKSSIHWTLEKMHEKRESDI